MVGLAAGTRVGFTQELRLSWACTGLEGSPANSTDDTAAKMEKIPLCEQGELESVGWTGSCGQVGHETGAGSKLGMHRDGGRPSIFSG